MQSRQTDKLKNILKNQKNSAAFSALSEIISVILNLFQQVHRVSIEQYEHFPPAAAWNNSIWMVWTLQL